MKIKRIIAIIFSLVLIFFLLCSCSETQTQYTVEQNGKAFTVDKESRTISDGIHTYHYRFDGNNSDYRVDITYPDGSSYWWNMKEYGGSGGWSDNYNPKKYADGDVLTNVLLENAPRAPKHTGGNALAIILLLAIGILNIAAPYTSWYLEYGWRYKEAEPSDAALFFNRLGGVIAIIIAIVLLFV